MKSIPGAILSSLVRDNDYDVVNLNLCVGDIFWSSKNMTSAQCSVKFSENSNLRRREWEVFFGIRTREISHPRFAWRRPSPSPVSFSWPGEGEANDEISSYPFSDFQIFKDFFRRKKISFIKKEKKFFFDCDANHEALATKY